MHLCYFDLVVIFWKKYNSASASLYLIQNITTRPKYNSCNVLFTIKYPCLYNSFPVTYQLQKYLADWIKNIYYSGSSDSVEVLPSRFENVPPAFKSFSSKKKTKKSKKLPTYCVFCKVGSYIKYSCHLSKSIHDSNRFIQQVSIQFFDMFQIKYGRLEIWSLFYH